MLDINFIRDNKGRKDAEERQSIEYQQLISIFEGMQESIYISDPDTYEILYANSVFTDNYGLAIGEKCYRVLQSLDSPCPFCTNNYIFGENLGKSYIWESYNVLSRRWYRCTNKAIKWPDDRYVRFEMAIDITEYKNTVEALRESEEKYRIIFNKANDATFLFEDNLEEMPGRFIEVNDASIQRLGYSREELLTMTPLDISTYKQEDINYNEILESRKKGFAWFEMTGITKNGERIPVEVSVHNFSLDSKKVGLAISRDISKRKELEKSISQRMAFQEAIAKVSRLFVSPTCVNFNTVLKIFAELYGVNRSYIYQYSNDEMLMENIYEWCDLKTQSQIASRQKVDCNKFLWGIGKILKEKYIAVNKLDELPPWAINEKEILLARNIKSFIAVPIKSTVGELIGFMGFEDLERNRVWQKEEIEALTVLAEMIGGYWQRKCVEDEQDETNQLLQQIIEFLPDATFVINNDKKVIAWNRAIEEMTGVIKEEIIGKGECAYSIPFFGIRRPLLIDLIFEEDNTIEILYKHIKRKGETLYAETYVPDLYEGKGAFNWGLASPLYDPAGKMIGAIESMREVTEQKKLEEKLHYMANHDALTSIPNRYSLEETLKSTITKAKVGVKSALFFIDIDNFKLVNDTMGHAVGDKLLIALIKIIESSLRKDDILARLGGDEFAVILEDTSQIEAEKIAEKLRWAVCESEVQIGDHEANLNLSISIGCIIIDGELNHEKCLSLADAALYTAKEEGRNRVFFAKPNEEPLDKLTETNQIVSLVKKALQKKLFTIDYQPVVSLVDGKIIHYEALLRLKDKQGKMLSPAKFIPLAEKFGLMPRVDLLVVQMVLKTLHKFPQLKVFVNMSGLTLDDEIILQLIENMISESGIEPSRLGFEITETAAVKDILRAERWVTRLKNIGSLFALDDFGTGFSSIAYLHLLPVDYIKIDGSFVREMDKDPVHKAMIQSINTIASTLGKKTVAESIESEEILNMLKNIGVDCGQGFYLGRPGSLPEDIDAYENIIE
ncbi:MAG: hypothetical protein CVV25_09870 [Ignavibacteriae bacterium HGW-Ignavibacteriae-4]|jgi:diguanylate cyclase (GGDEF)-like protein/PAS domain S-box-containing protein|nr:MAG: hypothetical protein CVV25_09870 [Ignavibacteriae bacterium HGW-Ignavibacteriae-4]